MSLIAIARNKSLSLAKANKPISSGSILNSNIANSHYPSLEGILGLLKAQEEREDIIYNRALRNLLNKGNALKL